MRNLEKIGLLKKGGASNKDYLKLRDSLNLINEKVNKSNPDDISYVFDGFSPITIRLVEMAIGRGWNVINNELNLLQGQSKFPENGKFPQLTKFGKSSFILIVFIGGITYAEIAAIRLLNKLKKDVKFVILTTHILNGKKLIDSFRLTFDQSLSIKDYQTQLKQIKT